MTREPENSYQIVEGDWNWIKHNAASELDLYADASDALQESGAVVTGERRIVADGQIALTPIAFEETEGPLTGYLVEDLREVA